MGLLDSKVNLKIKNKNMDGAWKWEEKIAFIFFSKMYYKKE
jgi:hypothetical protein